MNETIRAATFNVRYGMAPDGPNGWEFRKGILIDAIRELRPDVMGVQECHPYQADEIKMNLPHLDRLGVGRYHGTVVEARPQESRCGEHCDVWFDTNRFVAASCGTFWHSETPETAGSISWGNPYPRITTWAVLQPRSGGRSFVFFCTHCHGGEPCSSRTADLMARRIRMQAGALPRILVGDFNHTPETGFYARMTGKGPEDPGLTDVWTALGNGEKDAGTCHEFDGKPKTRIDWILTGGGFVPVSVKRSMFQKDGRFPSDHFPILAELSL
jgi:endonuclease/exonuclease/phosphatase family metal-dependent hydrolase